MKVRIKNSIFDGFYKEGNGGVCEVYSKNIFIFSSSFFNCKATTHGGCLYFESLSFDIRNTAFYKCSVTAKLNEQNGNALYSKSTNVARIDCISTRLSGESKECCSDSSIKITNAYNKIVSYNASDNYGTSGSSLIAVWSSKDGSYLKYLQDVRGRDTMCIESSSKQIICMLCNFIECKTNFIAYMNSDKMILFKKCNFINTACTLFNKECEFIDCLSDGSYSEYMNTTLSGHLITHNIFFNNINTCKFHSSNKGMITPFIYLLMISFS